MLVSVVCSTYNSEHFLSLVLESLQHQSYKEIELLIADDGSGDRTKKLIDDYRNKSCFHIEHVWHEDLGYRKATIHNNALRKCKGELLIFIDGDCVLSKNFIKDHLSIYEGSKNSSYVFMGRRVELGEKLTNSLSIDNLQKKLLTELSLPLLVSCISKDSRGFGRSFSIKNEFVRKVIKADNVPDLLGCNFSLKKETMNSINGFNEDYKSYWGEDGDIFIRLRNNGCKLIGMKYYAVQYHLYHKRLEPTLEHVKEYERLLSNHDYKWAKHGLF